jgi:Mn-dependent DtxR family transcriptional regulator
MNHYHRTALKAVFRCASQDLHADLSMVADELGLSCVRTDHILEQLAHAGLVDADRVRLTLAGLAVAASLPTVKLAVEPPSQRDPRGTLRLIA